CMDAAGSLRAAREVFSFSASPLPSSALLPEKKTSTGRSVELASGINAPSPRPRPRFLRSATTYSSIRYFLSGLAVGQRGAGMAVIVDHGLAVGRGLGDPQRGRERCAEGLPREMRTDVLGHLSAESGARIVHRQQNGRDRQFGIEVLLD